MPPGAHQRINGVELTWDALLPHHGKPQARPVARSALEVRMVALRARLVPLPRFSTRTEAPFLPPGERSHVCVPNRSTKSARLRKRSAGSTTTELDDRCEGWLSVLTRPVASPPVP